jgi:hypothetical protein
MEKALRFAANEAEYHQLAAATRGLVRDSLKDIAHC